MYVDYIYIQCRQIYPDSLLLSCFLIRGEADASVSCCFLSQPKRNTKRRERSGVRIDVGVNGSRTEAGFRSFTSFVTTVGGSWRACEYLVTTTGLSMHYQPKDFFVSGRPGSPTTEGSLHTSWVSHFSGCHNSSCNI